jgi:hypothetical protein
MAANFSADEKNAELKFQYMLHADKKSAEQWKDLPIPFPVESKSKKGTVSTDSISGISQLPDNLKNVVYRED